MPGLVPFERSLKVRKNCLGLPLAAGAASEKALMLFSVWIGLQTPTGIHCFAKRRSPKLGH